MKDRARVRKRLVVLFSALVIAAASGSVIAGQKLDSDVRVTSTSASGAVGNARASADTNQMISCSISGTATSKSVSCAARDAAGNYFSCTGNSNADHLAAAAAAIGSNTRVVVYGTNSGACTQIIAYNGSQYKPVVP